MQQNTISLDSMKRFIPVLPWLGALLLIAVALLCFESDLLWRVQMYNLFLDTPLFFRELMVEPGGMLSYLGCYFTQFFYHPWLGVLMLCVWWLLLMWLTKRTFRIADNWTVLALIPVAILLVADMSLGYWHYFMKLRGYFFVPTIGTTAGVAMLWAFRALPEKLRIGWVILAAAVGYPLMGAYALATVLLMGIWTWRLSSHKTQNAILTVVALLCIIAVPLICYRYVYYQTNMDDIWTVALPAFVVVESYPSYYIPYYILGAFFLLMVVCYVNHGDSPHVLRKLRTQGTVPMILQGLLLVALIAGVWHWWYKDDNFHHELMMQQCIEQKDWEGVIREGQKQGDVEPTRAIVVMHNLALQRLGRQLDEMNNFPKGKAKSNAPMPINPLYQVFGRMIYYQYGLLNDCHRLCMEDGVEHGWHVETLMHMVRCSILMGETQAAKKILAQLRHTQYYGPWADDMQQLIGHPQQLAENPETGFVMRMLHYKNSVGADGGLVENYVMNVLAAQDADDPYFQEQAVLATLWLRDAKRFWPRFFHYARLKGQMPRIFQEAAYLFGKVEGRADIDKMPFDKSVKDSYAAFMKEAVKYDNRSVDIGRVALYPFFGNTYFYEYYFLKYGK